MVYYCLSKQFKKARREITVADEELEKIINTWESMVGSGKLSKNMETMVVATLKQLYKLR